MQDLFQNMQGSRNTPADLVADQLEGLADLSIPELKKRWLQLCGSEPPRRLSRELLTRAIAYKMQEKALGGLKPATKRKLSAMVTEYERTGKVSLPAKPLYKPGARLVRQWHRKTHSVTVLDKGFEYEGKHYRSLSAIAREITGARWSGPRFFGISS